MKIHLCFFALIGLLLSSPAFVQAQATDNINLDSLATITAENASTISERSKIAQETYISDLAFSPDGNMLASASDNNGVYLWNLRQQQTPLIMIGGNFATVAFSPDGKFFAAGGSDSGGEGCECVIGSVHLYDAATYEQRALLEGYGSQASFGFVDMVFYPAGTTIFTVDAAYIASWDLNEALQAGTLELRSDMVIVKPDVLDQFFHNISMIPDGKLLAYTSTTNEFDQSVTRFVNVENQITLWDTDEGAVEAVLPVEINEWPVTVFNPDGSVLASGGGEVVGYQDNGLPIYGDANPIRLWDVVTGQQKAVWSQNNRVSSIAFNPDGTVLATGDWDGHVRIWDVASGTELIVLEAHKGVVVSVVFSPDGKLLASGGESDIRLWGVPVG